jgi:hypothetical protein
MTQCAANAWSFRLYARIRALAEDWNVCLIRGTRPLMILLFAASSMLVSFT